jgi:hypothetical protein
VDSVTQGIERLSNYLGSTSGDRMLQDIETFGRRRPWGMVGIGLGLGLVASRFLKASSSNRYTSQQQQPRPAMPVVAVERHHRQPGLHQVLQRPGADTPLGASHQESRLHVVCASRVLLVERDTRAPVTNTL